MASNRAHGALIREVGLDDTSAVRELVESGVSLYEALSALRDDNEFWATLETASTSDEALEIENRDDLALFYSSQQVAALQVLGYQPPPPVQDLVDETLEALRALRELGLDSGERREQLDRARNRLELFLGRLEELLFQSDLLPGARRRLLRRMLRSGAKLALLLAPIALGYAVKFVAQAHSLPGDPFKDAATALAGTVSIRLDALLPETRVAESQVALIAEALDAKSRARALLTVVRVRLLRIDLGAGLTGSTRAILIAAANDAYGVVARNLVVTDEFRECWTKWKTTWQRLAEQPSEEHVAISLNAWTEVENVAERLETKPSNLASVMDAWDQERRRRLEEERNRTTQAEAALQAEQRAEQAEAAEALAESERAAAVAKKRRQRQAEEERAAKEPQQARQMFYDG
jgi:hypothetical protein